MVLASARLIGDLHSVIIQVHCEIDRDSVTGLFWLMCLNEGLEITELSVLDRESQLIFAT